MPSHRVSCFVLFRKLIFFMNREHQQQQQQENKLSSKQRVAYKQLNFISSVRAKSYSDLLVFLFCFSTNGFQLTRKCSNGFFALTKTDEHFVSFYVQTPRFLASACSKEKCTKIVSERVESRGSCERGAIVALANSLYLFSILHCMQRLTSFYFKNIWNYWYVYWILCRVAKNQRKKNSGNGAPAVNSVAQHSLFVSEKYMSQY